MARRARRHRRGAQRSSAMKHYIRFPRADGTHSRQAHADLPAGTFEREMGKEGFFGPAAHFHHTHPPTAWDSFSGALNPHAYDLDRLPAGGRFAVGRDAVHAQRRREDPPLEDRPGDGPPRPQPGRRRAAVHPRRRGRVLLRLGPARLPRRRLHRDSARRHVAHRAVGADDDAARRVHRGHVHDAGEGHPRPARDLRPGDARRAGDGRGVPRAADRRPVEA